VIDFKNKEERGNALKTFLIGGSFIMCLWAFFPYLIKTFIDPHLGKASFGLLHWLGGVFSVLGYCLAVWCVMLFIKEGNGTPLPYIHPKRLVESGPYKFVRNPMVLGTVLFLFGSAIIFKSYGILTYAFLMFFIMHFFVLVEEKALKKRFGDTYLYALIHSIP